MKNRFRYTGKRVAIGPVRHPRALGEAAIAHIEAHPEEYAQETYRRNTGCGTVLCFAGHVANIAGIEWRGSADSRESDVVLDAEGNGIPVATAVSKMLGVEYYVAYNRFFDTSLSLDEIKAAVATLPETQDVR